MECTNKDLTMKTFKTFVAEAAKINKSAKRDVDLDDLTPVKYPSLDTEFAKRNAKKKRMESLDAPLVETFEPVHKDHMLRKDLGHHGKHVVSMAGSDKGIAVKFDRPKSERDLHKQMSKHFRSVTKSTSPGVKDHVYHFTEEVDNATAFMERHFGDQDFSDDETSELIEHIAEAMSVADNLQEVLNVAQRRKRAIITRRNKSKMQRGRRRQSRRIAGKERLGNRSRRQAKTQIVKKLTKGVSKQDLSPQRKAEMEKRLKKMDSRVGRLQKRILPTVRKRDRGM
jgi:hypothetical protein